MNSGRLVQMGKIKGFFQAIPTLRMGMSADIKVPSLYALWVLQGEGREGMGEIMIGQTNKKLLSGKLQRALRNNMSDAEQAMWHFLRGRQIYGLKFRRQHPFADYILDFVCPEIKLVIEVDGGQHEQQAKYDENRTQRLQAAGFRVLRFWNNEVLEEMESVKEKIWLTVLALQPHPHPDPPLEGEGEYS